MTGSGGAALLPFVLAVIFGGFALLAFVAEWLDRRERRHEVWMAHQPRTLSFDNARAIFLSDSSGPTPARPFAAAHTGSDVHLTGGGGSIRQEDAWQ